MDYNFLSREMTKPGNFENLMKYLKETADDAVRYSDYFIYRMATNAKEYFKALVLKLDNDPDNLVYTTLQTKEFVDEEATAANASKYRREKEMVEAEWKQYRDEHAEEFIELERVNSADNVNEYVTKHFVCDLNFTLQEAFQGYLCANDILKMYGKDTEGYTRLPKYTYTASKDEFKEKHANIKAKLREKHGLPEESEFKVTKLETRHVMKTSHAKALKEITDEEPIQSYTQEFYQFIVSAEL